MTRFFEVPHGRLRGTESSAPNREVPLAYKENAARLIHEAVTDRMFTRQITKIVKDAEFKIALENAGVDFDNGDPGDNEL